MDEVIMDRFFLKEPFPADAVVNEENYFVKVYNDRRHMEHIYRTLHDVGILVPKNPCVVKFNLVHDTVFFEFNITKALNEYPMLNTTMKKYLTGESLDFWNRLVSIKS